jgi:hypothetical protein
MRALSHAVLPVTCGPADPVSHRSLVKAASEAGGGHAAASGPLIRSPQRSDHPARSGEVRSPAVVVARDENGRKRTEKPYFYSRFYIFLAKTGSGSENAGSKTESEYTDIRKRTNTDEELEN